MENNCNIVKDLIPLYAEGLTSEDSAKLVEGHVSNCAGCAAELEKVRSDSGKSAAIPDSAAPLKAVNKTLRQRRLRIAALCALCVFLVLTAIFSASVKRNYIPYSGDDDVIAVEQLPDGGLRVKISDEATAYEIEYISEDGDYTYSSAAPNNMIVYLWNTDFGRLTGETVTDIYVPASKGIIAVDYCDCAKDGELIRVFGDERDGGAIVLKRLVLGYFAIVSAVSLVVFGLLWFILRKRRAGRIMGYLFCLPASYLLAHLIIMGRDAMTYAAAESFGFIVAAFAAIFAIAVILMRWKAE